MLEDPEPREGSGPALRAGLKAPWRVSAPSSCKGALKLARGRRKGGCLASWVSRSYSGNPQRFFDKVDCGLTHPGCDQMGLWVSLLVPCVTQIGCDAPGRE